MSQVVVNGVTLAHEVGGSGAPLAWVHGGFACPYPLDRYARATGWGHWELEFAASFQLLTYTRRGCWPSTLPGDGFDLEGQAEDLKCLLDHLGIQSTHIVGSSAGGPIAIVFAAMYPKRTRSLLLTGTALQLFPEGDPVSDHIRRLIGALGKLGPAEAFARRPEQAAVSVQALWEFDEASANDSLTEFHNRQADLRQLAEAMPHHERVKNYEAELRNIEAYMEADIEPLARRISTPTLVLHGEDEGTVPLNDAKRMADIIPSAALEVVPGVGHGAMYRSAEARQLTIQFLLEVETGRDAHLR